MPDQPREIIVPHSIKYAVWPGREWGCAHFTFEGFDCEQMLLRHGATGQTSELKLYRLGMLRKGRG